MAHGGARPGSGRKRKDTIREQQTRRDVMLEVFTVEEWRSIARQILGEVKGGNLFAVLPYLPYILGSPKQEINVTGQVEHVRISEIRQAIGMPNIIELNAPKKASGDRQ